MVQVSVFCICAFPFLQLEQGTTLTIYFRRTVFLVERLYVAHLFPLERSRKFRRKFRDVEPGIMLFQRGNICNFRFIFVSASKKYHVASQYLVFRFITSSVNHWTQISVIKQDSGKKNLNFLYERWSASFSFPKFPKTRCIILSQSFREKIVNLSKTLRSL